MAATLISSKPHIVIATLPFYGHVRPLRSLAISLAALGYQITFIAGKYQQESLDAIAGVRCVPMKGHRTFDPKKMDEEFPGRNGHPAGVLYDFEHMFFGLMHDEFDTLREVLEAHQEEGKQVILIQDASFVGSMPMLLGTAKMERVPTISIGHYPLVFLSKDTAPFGTGLPSQGEAINRQMNLGTIEMFSGLNEILKKHLERYECAKPLPSDFPLDCWVLLPDLYLQLCAPALEPPRSDLPKNVRFCGALVGGNDKKKQPEWWDDFVVKESGKPLILVTSGSLTGLNVDHLIRPTIEACRTLPVRLVVCAVYIPFPEDLVLPDNIRWAQWIAFEDIMPYTSLIVSSGGYGGITQAFASGIPMILAGTTEDKVETGLRAEWTGAAVNLKTQTPSIEQLAGAVDAILKDPKYQSAALELKKAFADCNAVGSIVSAIEQLAEQFYGENAGRKSSMAQTSTDDIVAGAEELLTDK